MDDEPHLSAMEDCIRAMWKSYTESFLQLRQSHGDGHQALESIFVEAVGFIGLWILFLTIACPVVIMDVPFEDEEDIHAAQENLVLLSASALREYTRLNQALQDKILSSPESMGDGEYRWEHEKDLEHLIRLFRVKCIKKSHH